MNENHPVRVTMAGIPGKGGIKGRSAPPGNQNAFRHGLAAIEKRQDTGPLAPPDESIRQQILDGLISDKGGEDQVSTATRVLAEVIASDATSLMVFNRANRSPDSQHLREIQHREGRRPDRGPAASTNLSSYAEAKADDQAHSPGWKVKTFGQKFGQWEVLRRFQGVERCPTP
jgi:hypothetical protein